MQHSPQTGWLEGREVLQGQEHDIVVPSKEIVSLQTVGISKAYKGRYVVRDVNVEVSQGEVVGLLGPNGAGKTTTFYMIVGLTRPDTGSVMLGMHNITSLPMYLRAQNGISYLPQEPSVFRKLTVEANIMAILETLAISSAQRRERLENLLDEFGIAHVRRNLADTLSGGERRRVEIARSLVISPKFILLDEPFSGIDPITVIEIQKIIAHLKSRSIGVLITDHNVRETLQVTDRAYIINNGSIFRSGTPRVLGNDPEVKRVYLGERFTLD
jgi:lipopolysaccharide export system ATP-binding protein